MVSRACSFKKALMKRGSHSSLAIPRSLQQRIKAFDLQPSVAVGIPSESKYCCSPRAIEISLRTVSMLLFIVHRLLAHLPPATRAYSRVTSFWVTMVSPRGARPHPPGLKALLSILRYLISGRYTIPSGLISMSCESISCWRISACSEVKASEDKPWYDLVQSICLSFSSRTGGGSSRPFVKERSGSLDVDATRDPEAVCGVVVEVCAAVS